MLNVDVSNNIVFQIWIIFHYLISKHICQLHFQNHMFNINTQHMYNKMRSSVDLKAQSLVEQMQRELFSFLKVRHIARNIQINEQQTIRTVFVPTISQNRDNCDNFYVGHGFGGSSLMSFMFIEPLLHKGNVIFWEIRGMGFSNKLEEYPYDQIQDIEAFFLKTIEALLSAYKHKNCSFICHSFSAYILLLFAIKFPILAQSHIKKLLLLSPIGITSKENDYKNNIRNCSDIFHTIINKIGWTFNLTYKSPLRTICGCCKKSIIMSKIQNIDMSQPQKQILYKLIQTFILLKDGSQCLFFKLFEPRVIPKAPLQPLYTQDPLIDIVMVYGGDSDWVDKTGAKRISQRFPNHISLINVQNCGHNIPFDIVLCRQLFQKYL